MVDNLIQWPFTKANNVVTGLCCASPVCAGFPCFVVKQGYLTSVLFDILFPSAFHDSCLHVNLKNYCKLSSFYSPLGLFQVFAGYIIDIVQLTSLCIPEIHIWDFKQVFLVFGVHTITGQFIIHINIWAKYFVI